MATSYRPVVYLIYLSSAAQAAALQAQYPTGLVTPPAQAAQTYNAPLVSTPSGGAVAVPRIEYQSLYGHDLTSYVAMPLFTPSNPNGDLPQPLDKNSFYWVGFFLFSNASTRASTDPPVCIGARLWVDGFEIPFTGEGSIGLGTEHSKASSRLPGGHGLAYRSAVNNDGEIHSQGTPLDIHWERFYFQPLSVPAALALVWTAVSTITSTAGASLQFDTDRVLKCYNKAVTPGPQPGTLIGQSLGALTLGQWYRIDLRVKFAGVGAGAFRLYINGVLQFDVTVAGGAGLSAGHSWARSALPGPLGAGSAVFGTPTTFDCNYDDWIGAQEPTVDGVVYPGFDLSSGSHVYLQRPTGLAAGDDSASYTGNWRTLTGHPRELSDATSINSTTTALATRRLTTDYIDRQLGCPAFSAAFYKTTVLVANGRIGWKIGSAAEDLAAPTAYTKWAGRVYTVPDGQSLPLPTLGTVHLIHEKNNDAVAVSLQAAGIAAEIMGFFGPEDSILPVTGSVSRSIGHHNSPFPDLVIQSSPVNPLGTVAIASGTYVGGGNNVGQDVLTHVPLHWLWIRRTTGAAQTGVLWYSSMETPHRPTTNGVQGDLLPQLFIDSADGQPKFRVAGADLRLNESGSTYQWVGVSDDAMRFILNNCHAEVTNKAAAVQSLWRTQFNPDYGFFIREDWATTTGDRCYIKGPAHANQDASPLGNASVTDVIGFSGAGQITVETNLNTKNPQDAYSLWRKIAGDGSGGDCSARGLFDVVTYVGDGAVGTRNIAVSLNGRSPLFAIVTPMTGVSFVRDPGHTGVNSQNISTAANSTTAIVGGDLNVVTVGTTLNALGVTYTLFVIPGNIVPGGWSTNLAAPIYPVPVGLCLPDCWGPSCSVAADPPSLGGCPNTLEPAAIDPAATGCAQTLT